MKNNNQSNHLVKLIIIGIDFVLLNTLLVLCALYYPKMADWIPGKVRLFIVTLNVALLFSHYYNSPIIHKRLVSVGDILRRLVFLDGSMVLMAYLMMRGITLTTTKVGQQLMFVGTVYFFVLLFSQYVERMVIKSFRQRGGNTRRVTFIGSDSELLNIRHHLLDDASKGYRIEGYYADNEMKNVPEGESIKRLGTLQEFLNGMDNPEQLKLGEEMYVCLSRLERETVRVLSRFCDQRMIRFYYVPLSVETFGIDLKRELIDDMEVYTTYENPLEDPINKLIKRTFDVIMSLLFLIPTLIIFPIIWIIIKTQSPGPVFFKQVRTGMDGRDFYCYKFRSMHVNDDADNLQATKDDPRKFPFGNFMRKMNIDELPQFWNVLKGDMSLVGPRPHMLKHTEQFSQLIDKYMVRHFVKPGITGWAQVTGFRGETKEFWQLEGRVKRDIWYIEHWSIWLDFLILWMTLKSFFVHDKNAY